MANPLVGVIEHSLDQNAYARSLREGEEVQATIKTSYGQTEVRLLVDKWEKLDALTIITGEAVVIGDNRLATLVTFVLMTTFKGRQHPIVTSVGL